MVTYFNKKDLVNFGIYLLSEERSDKIIKHHNDLVIQGQNPIPVDEKLKMVFHADIENWLSENNDSSKDSIFAKPKLNEIPRRNKLWENKPCELDIANAVKSVELLGADERLTEAVILLQKAKDLVSDYIDSNN